MKRVAAALWLWYRGDRFRGWQAQVQGPTVQTSLEQGFLRMGTPARPVASGRTDRGVHARMQVVSVRLPGDTDLDALPARLAPHLPEGMGLVAARRAPRHFHAQWTAVEKEYRYRLCPGPVPAPWQGAAWSLPEDPALVGRAMTPGVLEEVLARYVGTRDFVAFHENSSPRKPRTLYSARLEVLPGGVLDVRLVGDGFARYMVRYLLGTAVAVAYGVLTWEDLRLALEEGVEPKGLRAPGHGLILWEVRYPPQTDAFPAALRAEAPGLPEGPPFREG
jgi:tRNA pseudouridine38-40 synthase